MAAGLPGGGWKSRRGGQLVGHQVPSTLLCCEMWESRAGRQPAGTVEFSQSHTGPVYSAVWVASKTDSEILTAGCALRILLYCVE